MSKDQPTCEIHTRSGRWRLRPVWSGVYAALAVSCSSEPSPGPVGTEEPPLEGSAECSIPASEIFDGGVGRDGIPALTNPEFIEVFDSETSYLRDDDRIIAVELDGQIFAVPHNILWRHEIVNLDAGLQRIAVTYCPLTGSSMVFDRTAVDGAEFGVSGLLFRNNLIMYDRNSNESLWPQMMRESRCGERDGQALPMVQGVEMEWHRLRELHPDARVIPSLTEDPVRYQVYPYGDYEELDSRRTLYPQELTDLRRKPKERVLGIPDETGGGKAYPFLTLADQGDVLAVNDAVSGRRVVVLWDGVGKAVYAYVPSVRGSELTLRVGPVTDGASRFVDDQTGSLWGWDGVAVEGPLAGERMEPIAEAFVAFWFAWAAFQPQTELYGTPVDEGTPVSRP